MIRAVVNNYIRDRHRLAHPFPGREGFTKTRRASWQLAFRSWWWSA